MVGFKRLLDAVIWAVEDKAKDRRRNCIIIIGKRVRADCEGGILLLLYNQGISRYYTLRYAREREEEMDGKKERRGVDVRNKI